MSAIYWHSCADCVKKLITRLWQNAYMLHTVDSIKPYGHHFARPFYKHKLQTKGTAHIFCPLIPFQIFSFGWVSVGKKKCNSRILRMYCNLFHNFLTNPSFREELYPGKGGALTRNLPFGRTWAAFVALVLGPSNISLLGTYHAATLCFFSGIISSRMASIDTSLRGQGYMLGITNVL